MGKTLTPVGFSSVTEMSFLVPDLVPYYRPLHVSVRPTSPDDLKCTITSTGCLGRKYDQVGHGGHTSTDDG